MELVTFGDYAIKNFRLRKKSEIDLENLKRYLKVGGGTALYDGIALAIDDMPRDERYKNYQKEMIVLTDGEECSSRIYRDIRVIEQKISNPGIEKFHFMMIGKCFSKVSI